MAVVARTNRGYVRPINEDSYFAPEAGQGFVIVADGMGGHQAGEVASAMAIGIISQCAKQQAGREISIKKAVSWIRKANTAIYRTAVNNPAQSGMGTTLTLMYFMQERALIAHVGDSRAYRLRGGQLTQLTQDHSLVAELVRLGQLTPQEARVHPHRNIITRALGTEEDVQIDAYDVQVQKGDSYLLCTDGLTGAVQEEEIARVWKQEGCTLEQRADAMIQLALDAGGRDNITLVLVDIAGEVGA